MALSKFRYSRMPRDIPGGEESAIQAIGGGKILKTCSSASGDWEASSIFPTFQKIYGKCKSLFDFTLKVSRWLRPPSDGTSELAMLFCSSDRFPQRNLAKISGCLILAEISECDHSEALVAFKKISCSSGSISSISHIRRKNFFISMQSMLNSAQKKWKSLRSLSLFLRTTTCSTAFKTTEKFLYAFEQPYSHSSHVTSPASTTKFQPYGTEILT
nr:hypothetical protein Iba_chr08eCG8370 [Ipomoea batatas]